jgi:acyl-coenzyme A thioesterase PaaI-like protein
MSNRPDPIMKAVTAIPFCAHLHLGAAEEGGLVLPDEPQLRNHLGTAHAGALYTLGEAASGAALLGTMPELAAMLLVAKTATIEYKKPAKGRVTALGTVRETPASPRERLRADGKVTIPVDVVLRDGAGVEVATMVVTWYARGR